MNHVFKLIPILLVMLFASCGSEKKHDIDQRSVSKTSEENQRELEAQRKLNEQRRKAREEQQRINAKLDSSLYDYDASMETVNDFSLGALAGINLRRTSEMVRADMKEIRKTSHQINISRSNIKSLFHPLTNFKYFKYPYDEFDRHNLQEKHKQKLAQKDYYVKGQKYYVEFPLNNTHLEDYNFDKNYYEIELYWVCKFIDTGIVLDNIDLKRRDIFVMNPTLEPIELSPDFGLSYTSKLRVNFANPQEAQRFKNGLKTVRVNFLIAGQPVFDLKEKTFEAKLISFELHTKSNHYLWRSNKWYLAFANRGYGYLPENNMKIYSLLE